MGEFTLPTPAVILSGAPPRSRQRCTMPTGAKSKLRCHPERRAAEIHQRCPMPPGAEAKLHCHPERSAAEICPAVHDAPGAESKVSEPAPAGERTWTPVAKQEVSITNTVGAEGIGRAAAEKIQSGASPGLAP